MQDGRTLFGSAAAAPSGEGLEEGQPGIVRQQQAFRMELDNVSGGQEAEIAVMVYDSMNMGGIWRPVWLTARPKE